MSPGANKFRGSEEVGDYWVFSRLLNADWSIQISELQTPCSAKVHLSRGSICHACRLFCSCSRQPFTENIHDVSHNRWIINLIFFYKIFFKKTRSPWDPEKTSKLHSVVQSQFVCTSFIQLADLSLASFVINSQEALEFIWAFLFFVFKPFHPPVLNFKFL